jgi:heme/copper-type cytochrome/quinol oxidase subunit 2
MNNQEEMNLNLSRCLVEKMNITNTIVTNVCSGEKYEVPNGTIDYIVFSFMLILLVIVLGVITIVGYVLYKGDNY